jgi:Dolichyl-phosphate-mannose-protein mannosyltransferase
VDASGPGHDRRAAAPQRGAALGWFRVPASSIAEIARVREARRPRLRRATLSVAVAFAVAALAIGIRWSHISSPPLDFALARQYHSFNIARWYYIRGLASAPAWQRRVAYGNYEQEPALELPILESTAATAYRIAGGERTWIPRLLSSLFWTIGAAFLYVLAMRLGGRSAALLAVALYLFFPFPLVASTSFQPDPAMIMMLLAAVWAVVRHHEQPSTRRLIGASLVASVAVLVKPGIAALFLLPLFAALAVVRGGVRGALTRPASYAYATLALLPTGMVYLYSAITHRFLSHQPGVEIAPRLLWQSFFWRGWLNMIEVVLRPPFFGARAALTVLVVALCGLLVARTRTQRAILLGLWTGYLLLGLVITNQTSSHDYYSLPLLPIVALSVAPVATVIAGRLRAPLTRRWIQVIVATFVLFAGALVLEEKAANLGLPRPSAALQTEVEVDKQMGALLHHSPSALVIDPGGLWYHGWVAGRYWPDQGDLLWERRNDRLRPISAAERFLTTDTRYWPAPRTMHPRPTVFVVGDPIQLVLQPDLCVLLSRFPTIAETPDYVIFDLTRKATATPTPEVAAPTPIPYIHQFPAGWRRLRRGMATTTVSRLIGRPSRVAIRPNLGKPVEDWYYGSGGKYVLSFVAGRLLVEAEA